MRLILLQAPGSACPYLPQREAVYQFAAPAEPRQALDSPAVYQELLDLGFRRNGEYFYRPACQACQACVATRVPVATFVPSRSQRRVNRRNADVRVQIEPPSADDEHWRVYERYQAHQHDGAMSGREQFEHLTLDSPIETVQMSYRVSSELAGVGIVDICPRGLSSVYFYFDPRFARRSLGVYSALCEIRECQRRNLPYWYLGFWVAGCRKMAYKALFTPQERLGIDGVWR